MTMVLCNHLKALLESAVRQNLPEEEEDATFDFQVILVGFSKGCVVLNQIIYELSMVSAGVDPRLNAFASRISTMYWLDGGHSGESNTWITDEKFLYHLAKHVPSIRVHVTPYQIKEHDAAVDWERAEEVCGESSLAWRQHQGQSSFSRQRSLSRIPL
ncbi:hypothetical protein OS493_030535 [Desmophyllum pertusum]|uniref:Uncharacterized protein n=1 Tax=Desmophyllum pertusum TaxID=174260 RepID=A0A9W9YN54_9CNID|nr:hypothetical protein OS493_030535 [Desmophyllum pertusum]